MPDAVGGNTTVAPTLRDRSLSALSSVVGRGRAKFLFKMYDLAKFDLMGRPRFGIGSIDITYRCNLKCKHCYFMEQGYEGELTDEEWIAKLESLKKTNFPFYQCSWIGGEPLLRKDLVERGMRYFKSNVVATNGTIELPDWRDCNFYVSVDGTRKFYREMRGSEEVYNKIKANILGHPQLKIIAAMVIAKNNHTDIEAMLAEWRQTNVKGVLFQFYTPIKGQTEDLWPGWELRDQIIDKLIRLRKRYGDFIINPERVLLLMKSDKAQEVTSKCTYANEAFCFNPQGGVKKPCMMGDKADCTRCGCILPFHMWSLQDRGLLFREIVMSMRKLVAG